MLRPYRRRRLNGAATPLLTCVVALLLGILTGAPAGASAGAPAQGRPRAAVSPALLADLAPGATASFLVYLREHATLDAAARLADRRARTTGVYRELTATAARSQAGLRTVLDDRKVPYTAYWISNALRVTADRGVLDLIAARPDVERVEPAREMSLIAPVARRPAGARTAAAEWGLTSIQAPRVWTEFGVRGEGVVVANIDTGVDHTHPALAARYRGRLADGGVEHDYNWFDPTGVCPGQAPCDNNAHGTHTMGTMVGSDGTGNEIGVAPGARWVAVKGCESGRCADSALLAAGQWILAPTDRSGGNPRPDLRPDIVNNSWGGGPNEPWYRDTVRAWAAAGIFPAFATGNAGPGCASAGSPGDYPDSYAVGAYGSDGAVAGFSSRGASRLDGAVKPDLAAPGVQIRSSVPGGGYAAFDGTSMATPHLAGTVALLWSAAPTLRGNLPATRSLLDDNAGDADDTACGGTADDNNTFGEGRLDAYTTVRNAPRGPNGRVAGTVTDAATGRPLAGVAVAATGGGRDATTGADGRYALTLPAGGHQLTATRYGYRVGRTAVEVPDGGAFAADLALTAAPMVTVRGTVTDGSGHGWPLYARLSVTGRPGGPVFTDPVTGRYAVDLPADTAYAVTVDAVRPGYRQLRRQVEVGTGDLAVDLRLRVEPACAAAGYTAGYGTPLLAESLAGTTTPAGWTVASRVDGGGGWTFDDPGGRGNLTGGTGGFAVIDSDKLGGGARQDTDLVTPPLDLSGTPAPYLRFRSDWRAMGAGDRADVDVSTDGGATWSTVWHQTQSRRGPAVEEISLEPAAGATGALVRFRFVGEFAWWWQVDDVEVLDRTCTPAAGGIVTGFTTDANTGAPLNGVTVGDPDTSTAPATSTATPDDPDQPDGYYWLFSARTGDQPFTAQRRPYQANRRTVTVTPDGAARADFALTAGRLTVGPASIESHQPYGSTRRATVRVTNTGNAPATVATVEQPGSFDLLGRGGAALIRQPVKGLSPASTGPTYPARAAAGAVPAAEDTAWGAVPNHPVAVYDNAAAVLDGRVYSVGGGTDTGTERKAWVYDPTAGAWDALPDLPTGRAKPSAVALAGRLYVLGGWGPGGVPVSTVDVFDPATGVWSTVAGAVNPQPAAAAGTAVVDGRAYLVGGCTDSQCAQTAATTVFDPDTGTFGTGPAYPHPVSWMSCGGIGGAVYCAGGLGTAAHRDGFVLDPDTGAWASLPAMPVDLWGAQYTAAGGLLVIAGGVTANSSALTNQTVAYDPAAGAWRALPNAQHARYRGAGACGAYKVGGSPAPFVPGAESERLGGLALCGPAADAPWLSTTPTDLVLAPGESRTVTVQLTATEAAGVAQPGRYTAKVALRSDTPYPVAAVPVTMNVAPPATWGRVGGTVVGVTCAGARVPLRATVRVDPATDPARGRTLATDAQGGYAYWVPRGRYAVIAAKDGWVPQVHRVTVTAGFVSTVDVDLTPTTACPFTGRF